MNHLYFKSLFYCSITTLLVFNSAIASAQRSSTKHADRYDLVANINKIHTDHRKIENLKFQINSLEESKNKKDLKVHREKLKLEKTNLKKDYQYAKDQESAYKKNKAGRIKQFEVEMKASDQHYKEVRDQIKSDLSKKNDFALQKHAGELLKAVQDRNEASTNLSMEKADMIATVDAMDNAWKRVRQGKNDPPDIQKAASGTTLTNK